MHILVGIFHYRTWLVYSNDGLPQIALGLREQASWMHTHLVSFLSFHILIALVHPLHGNPYSLTLISINGHLHSLLIRLVDVRLSPFLSSPHNPLIIFYSTHSAMSMARAHVLRESWKSLRILKYETIAWLVIGVVHDESILVWRKWNMTKLYDFVGMNFLWPCYFEKT